MHVVHNPFHMFKTHTSKKQLILACASVADYGFLKQTHTQHLLKQLSNEPYSNLPLTVNQLEGCGQRDQYYYTTLNPAHTSSGSNTNASKNS